jgi:hypothetical protein
MFPFRSTTFCHEGDRIMTTARAATKTTTTPPPAAEWTQVPPAPKVPNFWQGHGYTLHYASPGWDVHEGTHDSKTTLGPVLFHARKAADAKEWAATQTPAKPAAKAPAAAKAAAKPRKAAAAKATPEPPKAEPPDAESNAHVLDGVTDKPATVTK